MHEWVIEVQGQAELRQQAGDVVATRDVRQLVGQHGALLIECPIAPVRRQQNYRLPPADCRRRGQLLAFSQLDTTGQAQLGLQNVEQLVKFAAF